MPTQGDFTLAVCGERCQGSAAGFTFLAARAAPSRWADAAVAVDFVHAGGAEGAGRRLALIDV